ncbi:MAG: DUF4440 domain-containing protein [Hyphomicrobiales bacterium]|nr:DUF4440 domain-containing protein [Hyphomicrobiales bacterium]
MTNARARSAIDQNNTTMMVAFFAGDLEALGALYTDDARFMLPNSVPATGRSQIKAAFDGMITAGLKGLELQTDELVSNEDTIVEMGSYTLRADGNAEADKGSYIVLWTSRNGQWLSDRDIVCSSVAPDPQQ